MKTGNENKTESKKMQIYNLIILDESGSMSGVVPQTISGCNETINTIQSSQEKFADTQEHFISIYAFQSGAPIPSRYLVKNVPAFACKHITTEDYTPCGCTPLYDAIGSTLLDLKLSTSQHERAIGSVTIITDGYENDSKQYTLQKVQQMISQLKELGWNINFIGANIDVKQVAHTLNIDNCLEFDQDEESTSIMFKKANRAREKYYNRVACCYKTDCKRDFAENMSEASKGFFEKDEEESK